MTLNEFESIINCPNFPYKENLIVFIAYKDKNEEEYIFENQLLLCEGSLIPFFLWEEDWQEGEQDIEILGYVPVKLIQRFIPLNCEHGLHVVGVDHLINEFLEKVNG